MSLPRVQGLTSYCWHWWTEAESRSWFGSWAWSSWKQWSPFIMHPVERVPVPGTEITTIPIWLHHSYPTLPLPRDLVCTRTSLRTSPIRARTVTLEVDSRVNMMTNSRFGSESYAPARNMFQDTFNREEALAGKIQEGETTEVLKESSVRRGWVTLCWLLTPSVPRTLWTQRTTPDWYFEQIVVMRYTARVGFVGYTFKDVQSMASTGRSVAIRSVNLPREPSGYYHICRHSVTLGELHGSRHLGSIPALWWNGYHEAAQLDQCWQRCS